MSVLVFPISTATAAEHCNDRFYVDETLPNGARWDMCWEHRKREGIIFHNIYYTPKNQPRRMVLNHAAVAQIHVPYDDNGARYHDISDFGIGDRNMLSLKSDECPGGTRLKFGSKNVLCQQIEKRDFAFKSGTNSLTGHSLSLFSVSPVGAYYYIPTWRFMDDGTIEPWIGATGALQRFGGSDSRGWRLGDGRIGISHLHNFFWKLDFDLNGTQNNDVVEEINFPLVNGKRQRAVTVFNSEAARKVNPDTMRRWRVRDATVKNANNRAISYDIVLSETGHQDIGPASEPFTHNDFYVTRQNNGEKFASHNPSGARNLAEFVNGESINNKDIVIWAGITFYHMPRAEDAPHMDAHWSHIKIIPRDWHASNPLSSGTVVTNTAPTVSAPASQTSQTGTSVNLAVQASDIDGDSLSYSATGLPAGLSINSNTGVISGRLATSSAGNHSIRITVSDGEDSSTAQFSWTVTTVNTNRPPVLTSPGNQTGLVGDSINLSIQATDADGDSVRFSATGLPAGLTINSTSGAITGNLTTAGNYTVNLKASDPTSNATKRFNWSVTSAPSGSVSNQVTNSRFTMDGQINDWNGIRFFANDPDDVSGANNQIDWLKVAIAHSTDNIYLAYENRQNVDPNSLSGNSIPWGWQGYFDTDNNVATGFQTEGIGADFIIEGSNVQRYIGTGSSWAWESVGQAQLSYRAKTVEMSFPRALIGNPQTMRAIFEGNNAAFNGTTTDSYPNTGFLSYTFSGSSNTNTPPVANGQQISVGSGASISVILSASDVDENALSYQVTTQPAHGSLSGSAPNLVYTANDNYTGADSFKFRVNDGIVNSPVATVSVTVTSGQAGGAVSNFINSPITVNGNASDWSGLTRFSDDANDASGVIDWQHVTLAHTDQNLYLLYTNRGNVDPASSTGSYLAWGWQAYIDADNNSNTGFKTGGLGADFVIEGNQILRYTGSGSNWSWQIEGLADSQYSGNIAELSLSRSMIGNPTSLRVAFSGNNESYQGTGTDLYPDGQNSTTSTLRYFDYEFSGGGGSGNRPVAFTQTVAVTSGSSANITLIATDPENDPLTYNIDASPLHGTLTGTAPNVTYTPDDGFTGQDRFRFNANDGNSDSATVTVTINVTGSQTGVISNLVSSISVDGNIEEWSSLTSFADDPDDISGTNHVINWQRAAIAHNADTLYFMYKNNGAISADNNSGSHMNWGWQAYLDTDGDASTGYSIGNMGADYILEGTQLQRYTGTGSSWSWESVLTATLQYNADTAESSITRSAIGNPSNIRVLFRGDNGAYGGTAVDSYPDNQNYFAYTLSGGSQQSATRPVASTQRISVLKNTHKTISLSATDADNDTLTYRIIRQPSNGVLTDFNESSSRFTYQPTTGFEGGDSFSYVANDGTFDSSLITVLIKVGSGSFPENPAGQTPSNSGGGSLPVEWLLLFGFIALLRNQKRA